LVFGLLKFGLLDYWNLEFGIWDLGFGIWDLGFGIWDLGFGIWDLGFFERGLSYFGIGGKRIWGLFLVYQMIVCNIDN
jgi:hypothetical protein